MKTMIGNKRSRNILASVALLLFQLTGAWVSAQNEKEISLSAYPGFTLVNFEKALDYSDEYMEDWSEIHVSVAVRGFLLWDKPVQPGVELAWQRLYYAYYIIPYVPSNLHREFNVSTFSVTALGRFWPGKKLYALGGAGIHLFNDGVAPSVTLEAGYMTTINDSFKVPVSFRVNPVFGAGTPTLFSIGIGLTYSL